MDYTFKVIRLLFILFIVLSSTFHTAASSITPRTTVLIESSLESSPKQNTDNQSANDYNSLSNNRLQYFSEGNPISYIRSLFQPYFHYSKMSYIAALLIFLIYLFYFRSIDIYESEPWKYIIITFLAGILFSDFGIVLYDFVTVVLGWSMTGDIINDLFYTVFAIGGIEEFVKIIPLLILLRYTKIINEPIDYMVYAGVAALGFAFSENVMYFDHLGIGIIFSRALTAVVLHTSLSGIVAYGLMLKKYRNKKSAPIKMFLIAILMHGLYDLFLMNQHLKHYILVAYLILYMGIIIFNRMVSNSLSNSPYYTQSIHLEVRKIQLLLVGGLAGVFILQFLMLAFTESSAFATKNILSSSIIGIVLLPSLVMGFGKIKLHPKIWKSIKIPFLFTKIVIDNEDNTFIDVNLKFVPMSRNRIMLDYFPNIGEIYKQTKDSKKRDWFYIRLERLGHHPKYNNKYIVIKSKFRNTLLNKTQGIGMAGIYLINNKSKKPVFVGWCSIEKFN